MNKSHFPMISVAKPQVSCLLFDREQVYSVCSRPKLPPSRLVDAFDQVVEPLITENYMTT